MDFAQNYTLQSVLVRHIKINKICNISTRVGFLVADVAKLKDVRLTLPLGSAAMFQSILYLKNYIFSVTKSTLKKAAMGF